MYNYMLEPLFLAKEFVRRTPSAYMHSTSSANMGDENENLYLSQVKASQFCLLSMKDSVQGVSLEMYHKILVVHLGSVDLSPWLTATD